MADSLVQTGELGGEFIGITTTALNTTISLTQFKATCPHGEESLSEWGNQEYELAADRLNLTHRWIFFGSLAVSKIVQLVVNIEKQISCLKVFISSFSGKRKLKILQQQLRSLAREY